MNVPSATIVNLQRFSTEDGPGIRTTVFFKGCPMRCLWCQNPETVRFEPELVWHRGRCLGDRGCLPACMNAGLQGRDGGITIDRERCRGCGACVEFCPAEALELHGRAIPVDTLFEQLCRDTAFYAASGGGVTLSGGEPLAQPEAAIALLRMLGKAGVHTALDTCGAVAARSLADALEFAGLVLFDVKTLDLAKHEAFTGVPFARVDTAARIVNASETPVWVRTPVIPGYTDDEQTVRAIAQYVRDTFRFCERYDLLAYSNLCAAKYEQLGRRFPLAGTPPITAEHMERLAEAARAEGAPNVQWSGPTRVEAA